MSPSDRLQSPSNGADPTGQTAGVRFRLRYTKLGKLRFVSAIDLGRLWERALRKAQLPIAYSEGFSPHPKVSFPDALPLGYASTGEYAELTFAAPVRPDSIREGLNLALPDGMRVLVAVAVADGAPRLSKWLQASVWDLAYPVGVDDEALAAALAAVLAAEAVTVSRQRKDEITEVDARPAIAALAAHGPQVRALVHHEEPPIRPSELHQAIAPAYQTSTDRTLPDPALVTRVAQGTLIADGLSEALTRAVVTVDDLTAADEAERLAQAGGRLIERGTRAPDPRPTRLAPN